MSNEPVKKRFHKKFKNFFKKYYFRRNYLRNREIIEIWSYNFNISIVKKFNNYKNQGRLFPVVKMPETILL